MLGTDSIDGMNVCAVFEQQMSRLKATLLSCNVQRRHAVKTSREARQATWTLGRAERLRGRRNGTRQTIEPANGKPIDFGTREY